MSADTTGPDQTDPQALEAALREGTDIPTPLEARRQEGGDTSPVAAAVLHESAPVYEREPPAGFELADHLQNPLPVGSVISGPVTTRSRAARHLDDGLGWLVNVYAHGREPVPVITGQYYGGSPRLAIVAEITLLPGDKTEVTG